MKFKRIIGSALALIALVVAACGGGGGDSGGGGIGGTGISNTLGTLRVSVTDAPACGYDAVFVTIAKVRVHRSDSASDSDGGWSEIVLNPPRRIDLLELTNGALEELGQTELPPGHYSQVRLVLAQNSGADPFANAVVPTGGALSALTTPSAAQSGLKIALDLDIEPGTITDLVLDFDACKSVVRRGNSGQFNLKPVIRAIPLVSSAGMRVVGQLDASLGGGSTQVSVQSAGAAVKATVPDAAGRFVLYPVPAGSYDLVVAAPGRATAVITGVPVTNDAATTVASIAQPIVPAASGMRTVSGTVVPPDATLRVTQQLGNGVTIQVGAAAVDASSGAFGIALPTAAPTRAAYAAGASTFDFVTQTADAGRYALEAASNGAVQTRAIDVAAPVAPVTLTLP